MADGAGRRVGARRARLLLPAPPPEGRRGVRQPGARRRAGARARRVRRRGSRARPATAAPAPSSSSTSPTSGSFSLHGGQHAPAGRAPRHRGGHRRRPRARCSSTSPPAAGSRATRRRRAATRSRSASTPRTPAAASRPRPAGSRCCACPTGPGIRVDTGVAEGDTVPPEFDSMIAKIIAHGDTREQAIARLRRAVADTMVAIEEGTTNQGFLLELLGRPELRSRRGRHRLARPPAGRRARCEPMRHADAALVQAAIALCDAATADERARFYALARRGRPHADADDLPHGRPAPPRRRATASRSARSRPRRYLVEVDGARIEASVERADRARAPAHATAGARYRTVTALQDADLLVEVNGVPHRVSRDEGGLVRSHAPGRRRGDPGLRGRRGAGRRRRRGHGEHEDGELADRDRPRPRARGARVRQRAGPGRQAAAADRSARRRAGAATRASACASSSTPSRRRAARSSASRWLVLGYDVTPDEVKRVARRRCAAPADPAAERRLLELYADVRALDRPHADGLDDEDAVGSPQEHLHAFLRSLDAEAEGLPDRFVAHLERALAPLRGRGPRAHRRARGRRLPAVPRPAARGAPRARPCAALLAAPARARRAARGRGRRRVPRRARPPRGGARAARAGARRARPRGPLALLRRARRSPPRARRPTRRWRRTCRAGRGAERAEREAHIAALVDCPQPLAPLLEPARRRRRPAASRR